MIIPIVVIVVLVIAGGVAFALKSKGSASSGEFLAADPPAERRAPSSPAAPAPRADAPVAPAPVVAAPVAPPEPVADVRGLDELVLPAVEPEPPAPAPEPEVVATVAPEPVPEAPAVEDRPEPMVHARLTPPTTAPVVDADDRSDDDDDDDNAVLSRFKAPGARVASIPIPGPSEPAPVAAVAPEPASEPAVVVPEPDTASSVVDEPVVEATVDVDLTDDPVVVAEPEPVAIVDEPAATATPHPVVAEVADAQLDESIEEPVGDTAEVSIQAEADGSVVSLVDDDAVAVQPEIADAPAALTGDAAMNPVLDDPIVLTDEPALPIARLQPEPELDPVDHVLKALIHRAKEKQVGIAEVAAELVEQANLEDRDIDEVLADLVVRADDDNVDPSERLEELTLFNDSVPRRPGQLTDFDRLDKNARKKVIIRVLCLLVAMQEDNRLKPSEPRSEAETRHWPLARAVWPVPASGADDAADDGEQDKKLPGRRLAPTKR